MSDTAPHARPRDLDTHHLFTPPTSRTAWEARRRELRTRILFGAGLWPMPRKTPLRPIVTGRVEGPDYVVENVALQTLPGFYLCGNLYTPKGKRGPFPAIANPHGHWSNGRLTIEPDVPPAAPPPAAPAEGRGNLVSIGVNLARQGFVVFAYDMVGYNDTTQVNHWFANGPRQWSWGVSLLGLQLWNSIRVLDYLQSLPNVDGKRLGVTGASGGGTQTFLLTAVDDRVSAAVPVNMVSAYMQGGCLCENGPGLRVGTDNAEIAAMLAPKPLLLVCCTGDWTKNVPNEEWPAIRRVYDLYRAGDRTAAVQFNYQHNYNVESREAMYAWFGRWLLHDADRSHFRERPFEADVAKMRVWTAAQPMPKDALDEAGLTQSLIDRSEKQLAAAWPKDAAGLKRFEAVYRPALIEALAVPAAYTTVPPRPPQAAGAGEAPHATVIIAPTDQKDAASSITAALSQVGPGPVGQAPFLQTGAPPAPNAPGDLWAKFYCTYNQTPVGYYATFAASGINSPRRVMQVGNVNLVGLGAAGVWALFGRAVNDAHGWTVIDAAGLDTSKDEPFTAGLFAPGLRRAGDLRSAALLAAMRGPVCIYNARGLKLDAAVQAARATGLRLDVQPGPMTAEQIAAWAAR